MTLVIDNAMHSGARLVIEKVLEMISKGKSLETIKTNLQKMFEIVKEPK